MKKEFDYSVYDHISTEQITTDLKATEEVDRMERELEILREDRRGNRVRIYMHEGRVNMRTDFIRRLKAILEYRERKEKQK